MKPDKETQYSPRPYEVPVDVVLRVNLFGHECNDCVHLSSSRVVQSYKEVMHHALFLHRFTLKLRETTKGGCSDWLKASHRVVGEGARLQQNWDILSGQLIRIINQVTGVQVAGEGRLHSWVLTSEHNLTLENVGVNQTVTLFVWNNLIMWTLPVYFLKLKLMESKDLACVMAKTGIVIWRSDVSTTRLCETCYYM